MTDVILVFDRAGRHLKVAPSQPAHLYKPTVERVGKTLHEIFPREEADFFLSHIRQALDGGKMHRLEYELEIEGRPTWFEGSVSPMSEESVMWIARDITEHKQADQEAARLHAESRCTPTADTRFAVHGVVGKHGSSRDPGAAYRLCERTRPNNAGLFG